MRRKPKSPPIPESLYHTTLSITSPPHSSSGGSTRSSYILGTHTDLPSARSFALSCLESSLNYHPSDFKEFTTRLSFEPSDQDTEWPYGDNSLVYAVTRANQEFLVGLETKPNFASLRSGGPNSTPLLPENSSCDHLHYVLQTTTHYDQATGTDPERDAFQTTEIEGCYIPRSEALDAARRALRQENENGMFTQYDERDDDGIGEHKDGWPFGEDVVVHAVGQMGENYEVAVRTVPGTKRRRSKVVFEEGS
ncbi:hypothetical protein QBC44DRAFT_96733 [Cladorrhinum sp. PSN332]|nr:hypothetical protein QBC44DRAFT_96733 [Cladorrhinum sp. PSN332]